MSITSRWAAINTAALALGSIGPWRTVEVFGVTATEGGLRTGGSFTLALALIAAIAIYEREKRGQTGRSIWFVACAGLGLAFTLYTIADPGVRYREEVQALVYPGWGVYLAAVGSAGLGVVSVVLWSKR
jgi:hypothetical protein